MCDAYILHTFWHRHKRWQMLFALGIGLFLVLALPNGIAQAHALPASYSPAPNDVLASSPPTVRIRFSEQVNPDISRIVVVNPSNQEVDNHDSSISGDGYTMSVSLILLPAGTYVVAWRTHSADDGHVAGGSYIFHIKRADGTVPALSGPLPSGNIVGGAGNVSNELDGPTFIATLAHWGALVALTILLGMIFWWIFIFPRQNHAPTLITATVPRFLMGAELALEAILAATVIEVAAQAITLDGSARGLLSLPMLSNILTKSRFGIFITLRALAVVVGLVALWLPALRTSLNRRNRDAVLVVFGLVLAALFVYSGHGGAAPGPFGPLIDYVHVLCEGIWLGGLFALALFILPTLRPRTNGERGQYLAESIPAFSIPALSAVTLIAITGPLNASERMTSLSQLWTTAYGIVLSIKISLFLVMTILSYYHAFRLRPRLALLVLPSSQQKRALPAEGGMSVALRTLSWMEARLAAFEAWQMPTARRSFAMMGIQRGAALTDEQTSDGTLKKHLIPNEQQEGQLAKRIMHVMQIEAAVGAGVLFCAALLSPLAGTLAPPVSTTAAFGATGGAQTYTMNADGYKTTLSLAPGHFGTNTFTLTIANPDGTPSSNGSVFLLTNMVEMDMGTNTIQLSAASTPGTYTGQGELPMAGHWKVTAVIRTQQDPQHLHRVTFTVSASY